MELVEPLESSEPAPALHLPCACHATGVSDSGSVEAQSDSGSGAQEDCGWPGAQIVKLQDLPADQARARMAECNMLELTELYLYESEVSDAGLAHLSNLTNLTILQLYDTEVSDAGLAHLSNLTNLTELDLSRTQVSDAGLAHLSGLTNLTRLKLSDTELSDAGLAHLSGLTNLTALYLPSSITDTGLSHLSTLTNLKYLGITWAPVSRWDVANQVTNGGVTNGGVRRLRRALPNCEISPRY